MDPKSSKVSRPPTTTPGQQPHAPIAGTLCYGEVDFKEILRCFVFLKIYGVSMGYQKKNNACKMIKKGGGKSLHGDWNDE